jgi:Fe2+ transport system protein FeoA
MNLETSCVDKTVTVISLSSNCSLLTDLGFCKNLKIKKLTSGRNIICAVCGAKIALSKDLAQCIIVEEDCLDL